jgi:hypothetical protein
VTCGLCTSNPSRWALRRDSILRLSTPRLSRSSLSQPSTAYQNKNDTTTSILIRHLTSPHSLHYPHLVQPSPVLSSPAQPSPPHNPSNDTSLPNLISSPSRLCLCLGVPMSFPVSLMYVSDVDSVVFVRSSGCRFVFVLLCYCALRLAGWLAGSRLAGWLTG